LRQSSRFGGNLAFAIVDTDKRNMLQAVAIVLRLNAQNEGPLTDN
jgi:hypothetical protein